MSKQSFKNWLDQQEEYFVNSDDLEEAQDEHNVRVKFPGGQTRMMNDDGTVGIPHRDIRHANWVFQENE